MIILNNFPGIILNAVLRVFAMAIAGIPVMPE
jgi:hypothetical protein